MTSFFFLFLVSYILNFITITDAFLIDFRTVAPIGLLKLIHKQNVQNIYPNIEITKILSMNPPAVKLGKTHFKTRRLHMEGLIINIISIHTKN